ncbi:MAG: DUF4382 domain-containing protein [Flavobacteriaceae bacterium]|nr:DUF4382 domain-containing protein [Flavobacteriaceae bacterium]
MKKVKYLVVSLTIILAGLFTVSCVDDNNNFNGDHGRFSIEITDAPMNYSQVMEVNITIEKIEMHRVNANKKDEYVTLSDKPFTTNMMNLINGVTETLAQSDIPVGDYDMIKLYMSSTNLKLKNGSTFNNDMDYNDHNGSNNWGGMMQGGMMRNDDSGSIDIPMDPYFTVENGMMETFLLDIDITQSFNLEGVNYQDHESGGMMMHISGYSFTPMMRFVQMSEAGTVQGTVQNGNTGLADATVYLMQNGKVYTTTHTNQNGEYKFIGIPEGSYTVIVELEGYRQMDVEWDNNVQMSPGQVNTVNCSLTPTDG